MAMPGIESMVVPDQAEEKSRRPVKVCHHEMKPGTNTFGLTRKNIL